MKYLVFVLSSVLIQLSSAQVLSFGIPNAAANLQGIPRTVAVQNNGIGLANGAVTGIQNFGVGMPITNPNIQLARYNPVSSLGTTNLVASNLANANLVSANVGANLIPTNLAGANIISNNLATVGNNFVGANLVNTNFAGQNNLLSAAVPINIANGFNINTGTFAIGNTGLAQILNLPCGIQIVGDALEVGGTVGVSGQLPFYSTVFAKGQLPTSGYGYASCSCGQ